jgi:hypothetical protein
LASLSLGVTVKVAIPFWSLWCVTPQSMTASYWHCNWIFQHPLHCSIYHANYSIVRKNMVIHWIPWYQPIGTLHLL